MDRPSYIIFDLDGTLVDSGEGIRRSIELTLLEWNRDVPVIPDSVIGPPLHDTFRELGVEAGRLDDVIATYRRHYGVIAPDASRVYPGISQLLKDARRAGIRLAVATSKLETVAKILLDDLGLIGHFDVVVGDAAVTRRDKRAILALAMDHIGASAPTTWMVGDRHFDIDAAAAHGVHPVGALWGYGSRDELSRAGARDLVRTPEELRQRLVPSRT